MPLAGGHHVVIAIWTQLNRTGELLRGQCRDGAEQIHLRFFSTKTAAHTADIHRHCVRRNTQHMRDHVLCFAWVLRRRIDHHIFIFAWQGHRDMAFEIHVILTANHDASLDPVVSCL